MARITPKLNWISSDVPAPSDFNRIENNNKQAFDEIDANEAQRDIDEAALQANIDEETAALQANIDAESSERATGDTNTFNSVMSTIKTTGGIGSYAFLANETGSYIGPGSIAAGSALSYAGITASGSVQYGDYPSGTWKAMGGVYNLGATLFVRIS